MAAVDFIAAIVFTPNERNLLPSLICFRFAASRISISFVIYAAFAISRNMQQAAQAIVPQKCGRKFEPMCCMCRYVCASVLCCNEVIKEITRKSVALIKSVTPIEC